MAKGEPFWNPARDAQLRVWAEEGRAAFAIVQRFHGKVSYESVRDRAVRIGVKLRYAHRERDSRARFWNDERDASLRLLWARSNPQLTLGEISAELGGEISPGWVTARARDLGLPARRRFRQSPPRVPPAPPSSKAPPILVYERVKGCTFIDPHGDGSRCGKGDKQSCAEHRARLLPLVRPLRTLMTADVGGGIMAPSRSSARSAA